MLFPKELTFKQALACALAFHAALFVVLFVRVSFVQSKTKPLVIAPQHQPIEAVAVSEKDLQKELKRLDDIERKKQEAILAEKRRKAEEAERKRLAELKKKQEAEAKRLAELKRKEEAEKQRLAEEKRKAEAEKQRLAEIERKKRIDAEKARVEQELQDRILAEKLAKERAEQEAVARAERMREVDKYKALVQQQIMRFWRVQGSPKDDETTRLFVRVSPNGMVLDVKLLTPSGNDALDRSAIAAIYKASPLPVPQDPELFKSFRELRLTLRPDSILSEG